MTKKNNNVFRIAPSPTGEMHIGTLGMALINYMLAKTTGGKFFLRIEDTDQKREVAGAAERFIETFKKFGLEIDNADNIPYQSKRGDIYKSYADKLLKSHKAYLDYGNDNDENIAGGVEGVTPSTKQPAIRLAAPKNAAPIIWTDLVKGNMQLPPLERDPVIVKSNGIPPYNLGHIVDDTLMRTTHVVRGEEWLPSTAEHMQLHEAIFGTRQTPWQYAHLPVISIMDGGNKRKLSKRKDREALVQYFLNAGYPTDGLIEYLLTIYNTDFEIWRNANPQKHWKEFHFRFEKIGSNSPLFDWDKLRSISLDLIAKKDIETLMHEIRAYFSKRDDVKITPEQYENIKILLNIDRGTDRPRKDIAKYEDVLTEFDYLFKKVKMSPLLKKYAVLLHSVNDKDEWFNACKTQATEFGFKNVREFTQALRVELTGRERSTDLYTISKILL
jgi:glutamyl-tRNA synthetase